MEENFVVLDGPSNENAGRSIQCKIGESLFWKMNRCAMVSENQPDRLTRSVGEFRVEGIERIDIRVVGSSIKIAGHLMKVVPAEIFVTAVKQKMAAVVIRQTVCRHDRRIRIKIGKASLGVA